MGEQYSRTETISACKKAMETPDLFYTEGCVNWKGTPNDADEPYTEIIAKFLIDEDNLEMFNTGIKKVYEKNII